MDLLAIAVADPTVLPLWAAFLFAVGMYPVGMFFGCSTCCDPCVCASGATLPQTITVTLNGFNNTPDDDPPPDTTPTITLSVFDLSGSGAGAQLTAVLGQTMWAGRVIPNGVVAVTVVNGGTGYNVWNTSINIILDEGTTLEPGSGDAFLTPTFDENGTITGVNIDFPGSYRKLPVYPAFRRSNCCGHYLNGKQFVLRRYKDSNEAGGISSFDFTKDGQTYSVPASCVYTHRFCGGWYAEPVNGVTEDSITYVDGLTAADGFVSDRFHRLHEMVLRVGFLGEGQPAVASIGDGTVFGVACSATWVSESNIETCSEFAWEATNSGDEDHPNGPSISVSPGGDYDSESKYAGCDESTVGGECLSCHVCCQGEEEMPLEIEAQVSNTQRANVPGWGVNGTDPPPGTYVLSRSRDNPQSNLARDGYSYDNGDWQIRLFYEPCYDVDFFRYPGPEFVDCKTCVKKCRVVAYVGVGFSAWFPEWAGYLFPPQNGTSHVADHCEQCEDVPLCNFEGRTFTLCAGKSWPWNLGFQVGELTVNGQAYDDGCGDVTITT